MVAAVMDSLKVTLTTVPRLAPVVPFTGQPIGLWVAWLYSWE